MKIKLYDIATVMAVTFCYLGFANYQISTRFGGVVYIGIAYLLLLFVALSGGISISNENKCSARSWGYFCIFLVVSLVGYEILLAGNKSQGAWVLRFTPDGFNIFKNFPFWCIGYLMLLNRSSPSVMKKLLFAILLYDIVVTLYALSFDENYVKHLTANIITPSSVAFRKMGAMGYGLTYSMAILIPAFIVDAKKKKNIILLVASLVFVYYVYQCSYFIALMALVLNIALVFVFSVNGKVLKTLLALVLMGTVVYAVVSADRIGMFFIDISTQIESYALSQRFEQIGRMLAYDDNTGDTLNRFSLYSRAVSGVISDGIWGTALFDRFAESTGHSTMLDTWWLFGFAGIVPLLLMLYYGIKEEAKHASTRNIAKAGYLTFVFISTFNPVLAEPQIVMTIIWAFPLLLREIDKRNMEVKML